MNMKKPKRGRPKKTIPDFKLPSEFETLDSYIQNHHKELSDRVIDCVEHALRNKLSKIEIFKFDQSPYSVTLNEGDYVDNIEHIYKSYIQNEYYEECPRLYDLLSKLKYERNHTK